MSFQEHKITEYAASIAALPDKIENRAEWLKKQFDARTDSEVKDKHNGLCDALDGMELDSAVKSTGIKAIRLNEDKQLETSADGKTFEATGSSGHSVTGEPASIGDAATSLNTIIPQKQGDSNPLPVIRMPMAQQAMPASKAEAKATNAQLLEKLRGSIPEIQGMQPVAEITGKEFTKNTEKNLVQQVGDYFRALGNKVFRRGLGEVVLDERGVKDSMAHGIGRRKAAAFAAVPQVIAQGRQIDTQQNWKGKVNRI